MNEELIPVYSTGSTGTKWVTQDWLLEQARALERIRLIRLAPVREFRDRLTALSVDRVPAMMLDLHTPNERFVCEGCDGYDDPGWPCRTVLLIALDYDLVMSAHG